MNYANAALASLVERVKQHDADIVDLKKRRVAAREVIMSVNNLTWQQLAVFVVCLAAAFAAHQWLGVTEGMAAGVVTSIIAFLMGRPQLPEQPPSGAP